MKPVSLQRLSGIFLRIGSLTFGGGDPTMAALQSELVVTHRWIDPETYGLVYALARVTPGTNLLAFCAGMAWAILGWPGAILAVAGTAVPAAVIVALLSAGYDTLRSNSIAMAAIAGTLAAAVGMMATGALQLLRPRFVPGRWFRALVIFLASAVLSVGFGMSPIPVLGLAAMAGFVWQGPPPK